MDGMSEAALHQQLGRIEGKLDLLGSSISRAHERIDQVEKDIRGIEKSLAKFAVYGTLASTVLATAVGIGVTRLFGALT
jgi:hypothetical protein